MCPADTPETDGDLLVLLAPGHASTPQAAPAEESLGDGHRVDGPPPARRSRSEVVLLARDVADLRLAVTGLAEVGTALTVTVVLGRPPTTLPPIPRRPEWPPLDEVQASRGPRSTVRLRFAGPVPARAVLHELAAGFSSSRPPGSWPVVGAPRQQASLWPVADPLAVVAPTKRLLDAESDFPPDLVLLPDASPAPDHPVLGRAPVVVTAEPDLTWAAVADLDRTDQDEALRRRGPVSLGPVDTGLLNPIGFDKGPVGAAQPLHGDAHGLSVTRPDGDVVVADRQGRVTIEDVADLRTLPGLLLDWSGTDGPQAYSRAVVGLACAGVPLQAPAPPPWARALIDPGVLEQLARPADLGDPLGREEHSVRLRRAALRRHGATPWRRALARQTGVPTADPPTVSILLATRRPDLLPSALSQIAAQRHSSLELVLATHGFAPPQPALDAFAASGIPLIALQVEQAAPLGEVLDRAAQAASGSVLLKMDDDDWYGPDFVADLQLARDYSGAELTGCPPEFTYIEALSITTRRPGVTEAYGAFVAGGTMLIDRGALSALGGFRHTRKYVDAQLLRAVTRSGGAVYRTHGLGYVLRRSSDGHTWDPGLGYFLHSSRAAAQWRGFRPSVLLEHDPSTLPTPPEVP